MCTESDEGDVVTVYHSVDNSRVYEEKDLQSFELPSEVSSLPYLRFSLHYAPTTFTCDQCGHHVVMGAFCK